VAADSDLLTIKQSEQLILQALGIDAPGSHCLCPLCKHKALRVGLEKKGSGVYLCQCMKCNGVKGDIFSVYKLVHNLEFKQALAICCEKLGIKNGTGGGYTRTHGVRALDIDTTIAEAQHNQDQLESEAPESAELDMAMAEEFIDTHHRYLMDTQSCIDTWLKGKRGISEAVAEQYRLGFVENSTIKMWSKKHQSWFDSYTEGAWVLPITDWRGKLRAIKLHFEVVGRFGKCVWMPVGKDPEKRYVSYNTFWPHLYSQSKSLRPVNFTDDPLWWLSKLPDGELKDRFESQKQINALTFAYDQKKAVEDLTPAQWEQIIRETFPDFQKDIQNEILARGGKVQPPRNVHGWTIWAPGELKALAYVSVAVQATALTAGEGYIPPPGMLRCFRGRRVAINWDADVPKVDEQGQIRCTGREFAHKAVDALKKTSGVREVRAFTWGRK